MSDLSAARRPVAEKNLEAILDAAEELLRAGRSLNFSAVAAAAGVSRPTVYAHFADRGRLVAALVERAGAQAGATFGSARIAEGPAEVALERLVRVGWEQLARHLDIARAAHGDLSIDALHVHHIEAERLITQLVERGQAEGAFRHDLPAQWLASTCLAVIHSAAGLVNSGRMSSPAAVDALVRTVVDLCVGAPRGRGSGRAKPK